ncbi:MAG: bifunctional UDP-N-acetylglucosamine diphosphorylase/glucosamine-1-phosphate N-acetyltransferase GlmU [Ilumatobacteraceae bacterium]|jgi:bifunctional UDP-N-acetylglucosamine pyrophosphorylase/glucosamine-1-phosphate N-acetyltransferase
MTTTALVLAAGHGTRMRSTRPKPLHVICGRPMVMHVIAALGGVAPTRTLVVVGHGGQRVQQAVVRSAPPWANVSFVEQPEQRGTGDATLVGLQELNRLDGLTADGDLDIDDDGTVLVLPGDTPLLTAHTVAALVAAHRAGGAAVTMLSSVVDDPTGYGRIVRAKHGAVTAIVEHKDATSQQREIREINTGIYAFRRGLLGPALRRIGATNAQGEYYLTDAVGVLAAMGHRVEAHDADPAEVTGVNDRWQLALAERELRARTNRRWLLEGVTMLDPRQTFIDVTVTIGTDVTLYPGVILQGTTSIGDGTEIGPSSRLVDCAVGNGVRMEHTTAYEATIGDGARVGPYAHLPAGTTVAPGAVTGSFYDGAR